MVAMLWRRADECLQATTDEASRLDSFATEMQGNIFGETPITIVEAFEKG